MSHLACFNLNCTVELARGKINKTCVEKYYIWSIRWQKKGLSTADFFQTKVSLRSDLRNVTQMFLNFHCCHTKPVMIHRGLSYYVAKQIIFVWYLCAHVHAWVWIAHSHWHHFWRQFTVWRRHNFCLRALEWSKRVEDKSRFMHVFQLIKLWDIKL